MYNELQCEFCHEVYTDPSDWVRHMTEQHEDRGYQSFKDLDKSVSQLHKPYLLKDCTKEFRHNELCNNSQVPTCI